MTAIASSELILNENGSIFHLHLKPEELADTVLLVGDPGRVALVSAMFDKIRVQVQNREFVAHTGIYKGKEISVISTGIGTDNIDIVVNELDALANIDFTTRLPKATHKTLNLIRVGTSGSIQRFVEIGSTVMSAISIGFDGLLNFYAGRDKVSLLDYEQAFVRHTGWNEKFAKPYFVRNSERLITLFADSSVRGMTISAPGFYGPQGRVLRLPLTMPELNHKVESFRYNNEYITNIEMESSAIAGLARLLGHEAITLCFIIANRVTLSALSDYKKDMQATLRMVLDKACTL